jgi:hypothetical protein
MKKKYLPSLILFIFGMILTIIGSLFKIMHWPGASILLVIGMLSEAIALILIIITLQRNTKNTM